MKKRLCIMLTFLVVMQLFVLCSCKKNHSETIEEKEKIYIHAGMEAVVGGDYVLFPKKAAYNYCDSPMTSALSIYNTALGSPEDSPLHSVPLSFYIVDKELTAENDGMPVFYALQNLSKWADDGKTILNYGEIILYDMATNTGKTIISEIPGTVSEFGLYSDTLLFKVDEADEGWNIYAIGVDGKNLRKIPNPDKNKCGLQTVYDGKVYYTIGGTKLYRCNLDDLSDSEYIFDIQSLAIKSFVCGDYIYYTRNQHKVNFEKGSITAYDLYRRPLDNLEKEELFIKDITRGQMMGKNFYYYTADNCTVIPNLNGSNSSKVSYDFGWGVLYCLNTETLESSEVYNIMGEEYMSKYPLAVSDEYIIFRYVDISKNRYTIVLDLKTGEEKILSDTVLK